MVTKCVLITASIISYVGLKITTRNAEHNNMVNKCVLITASIISYVGLGHILAMTGLSSITFPFSTTFPNMHITKSLNFCFGLYFCWLGNENILVSVKIITISIGSKIINIYI